MTDTNTDCNNKLMCDLGLDTQSKTKQWLIKNHPDKNTNANIEHVREVSKCYKRREVCNTDAAQAAQAAAAQEMSDAEEEEEEEGEDATPIRKSPKEQQRAKIYTCLRQTENWSKILPQHKFDNANFDPSIVETDLTNASPKLEQLFQIIKQVDENDMRSHRKLFKHFIFSDVKEEGYGAKILTSAFIARGYHNLITARPVDNQKSLRLTLLETEEEDKNNSFGVLSSSPMFNSEFSQKFKKQVLQTYNKRPENIHGADMRFIILDSGFKEGIDLFDVKYVHIFEPSMTVADLKQTIGRATRTCGQKGLHFEPNVGWSLYVYNYYIVVPDDIKTEYKAADKSLLDHPDEDEYIFKDATKMKDTVLLYSEYDRTLTNLAEQLYKLAPVLSVDFPLTENIHKIDDIAYLYDTMNERVGSSSPSSSSSPMAVGGAGTPPNGINCAGKCGTRTSKSVPATDSFLLYVYKKFGHPLKNVPTANPRAYFCEYMKTHPEYCAQLNETWATKAALVPKMVSQKMPKVKEMTKTRRKKESASLPSTSGRVKKSKNTTMKKEKLSSSSSTAAKYAWIMDLTDEELNKQIQYLGISIDNQPTSRVEREILYVDLLRKFKPEQDGPIAVSPQTAKVKTIISKLKNDPQLNQMYTELAPVKSSRRKSQLKNIGTYIESILSPSEKALYTGVPTEESEAMKSPSPLAPVPVPEPVPAIAPAPKPVPAPAAVKIDPKFAWTQNMTKDGLGRHLKMMGIMLENQPKTREERLKLYLKLLKGVPAKQPTKKIIRKAGPAPVTKIGKTTLSNKAIRASAKSSLKSSSPLENKSLVIANEVMEKLDIVPYVDPVNVKKYEILNYSGKKKKDLKQSEPKPPSKKLNFIEMRDFIKTNFAKDFTWDPVVVENKCGDAPKTDSMPKSAEKEKAYEEEEENMLLSDLDDLLKQLDTSKQSFEKNSSLLLGKMQQRRNELQQYIKQIETGTSSEPAGSMSSSALSSSSLSSSALSSSSSQSGGSRVITLNPTQKFICTFFTPKSSYKGLLLWHSVGTGKTCTAIATASSSFDKEGYTILWVTRNTLKGDVTKNMFDDVCHAVLAERMKKEGLTIPDDTLKRNRLIGDNWIEPISYKTFSNLLTPGKHNKYLERLIERNGKTDVLRKTLIVIDEAHKLYGGDLKAAERPDMKVMERLLMKSYKTSGKDSARLLIMTATPFTDSPIELFQLINLCKSDESEKIPVDMTAFKSAYMGSDNYLSNTGVKKLADKMSGYISYLNREQDPTQFAQPIMIDVPVMMSYIEDPELRSYFVKNSNKTEKEQMSEMGEERLMKEKIVEYQEEIKVLKQRKRDNKKTFKNVLKQRQQVCKTIKNKEDRYKCMRDINNEVDAEEEEVDTRLQARIDEKQATIEATEEEVKMAKSKLKELRKKMTGVKESLLQEVMLTERCKGIVGKD